MEHINACFSLSFRNPIFPGNLCCRNRRFFVACHTRWVCVVAQIMQTGLTYRLGFTGSNGLWNSPHFCDYCVFESCLNALFLMPLSAVFSHHHDDPLGDLPPDSPAPGPPPSGAVSLAASPAPVLSRSSAAPSPADAPRPLQIQRPGWAGPHHSL